MRQILSVTVSWLKYARRTASFSSFPPLLHEQYWDASRLPRPQRWVTSFPQGRQSNRPEGSAPVYETGVLQAALAFLPGQVLCALSRRATSKGAWISRRGPHTLQWLCRRDRPSPRGQWCDGEISLCHTTGTDVPQMTRACLAQRPALRVHLSYGAGRGAGRRMEHGGSFADLHPPDTSPYECERQWAVDMGRKSGRVIL